MQDTKDDLLSVKAVCNWYIQKTKDRSECYHGLGSLNIFLYILCGYSIQQTGKCIFSDKVIIHEVGPVFEKMLTLYESQAKNLCSELPDNNREMTKEERSIIEDAYRIFSEYKPQQIRDLITDTDSPWYRIKNKKIESESRSCINKELISEDVKRIIYKKI
jgi:uncharacterized phage-associated protein